MRFGHCACLLRMVCLLGGFSKHQSIGGGMDTNDHRARGGFARAEVLTPEQRREIARGAAQARWNGTTPRATHTGELRVGDMVIPCSVLEDGTRVLTESGFATALGRARSGSHGYPEPTPELDCPILHPRSGLSPFLARS